MYGSDIDRLNVYIKNVPALGKPIFTKRGTQGTEWNEQNINIKSTTYQVRHPSDFSTLLTLTASITYYNKINIT